MFGLKKTGDWQKALTFLKKVSVRLRPMLEVQLTDNGKFVLKCLREHIDRQDLNWTPLAQRTIELKGGDDTIYVDTGALRDGLIVKRIHSGTKGTTIFVGGDPDKRHPSGMSMDTLMVWLEYGTDRIPPRPLLRPTIEEVEYLLRGSWKDLIKDIWKGTI